MATINQVGVGLSGSTGTGTFVGATSPTLVTPNISLINAANGTSALQLASVSSAVNYLLITPNASASPVTLSSAGSDSDIAIVLSSKGLGAVTLYSELTTNQIRYGTGSGLIHTSIFNFPATAASQTYTFPDASGTVSLLGNSTTGSGAVVLANTPTLITPVLGAATATSINFGGSTLANYVEGTFTPALASSGGGGATYAAQAGTYTRIGNKVLFNLSIVLSGTTLAAGSVTITGLPIPLASGIQSSYAVYANNLGITAITQIMAQTGPGVPSSINLYYYSAGTVTALDGTQITATSQFFISGQYTV